jgi:multisite-specific tRNA:(cytosine-C5)-methyltransferase
MSNARFERYYRTQNIVSEEEWPAFLEALRAPLPTTFRVAGSRQCVSLVYARYETTLRHDIKDSESAQRANWGDVYKAFGGAGVRGRGCQGASENPLVCISLHLPNAHCSYKYERYPDGLAWQFNVPKKVLRKQPEFKKFHNFLVYETDVVRLILGNNLERSAYTTHRETFLAKRRSAWFHLSFSTSNRITGSVRRLRFLLSCPIAHA